MELPIIELGNGKQGIESNIKMGLDDIGPSWLGFWPKQKIKLTSGPFLLVTTQVHQQKINWYSAQIEIKRKWENLLGNLIESWWGSHFFVYFILSHLMQTLANVEFFKWLVINFEFITFDSYWL